MKRKYYKYLYLHQMHPQARRLIEKDHINFAQLPMDEINEVDISDFELPKKRPNR